MKSIEILEQDNASMSRIERLMECLEQEASDEDQD